MCRAIRGMTIERAQEYLNNVLEQKEIVPAYKFRNGAGHHRQAKRFFVATGRWPSKVAEFVRKLVHQLGENTRQNEKNKNKNEVSLSQIKIVAFDCGLSGATRRRLGHGAHGKTNYLHTEPCNVRLYAAVDDANKIQDGKELQWMSLILRVKITPSSVISFLRSICNPYPCPKVSLFLK